MKHTIKRQLAVVFIGLTVLTIASCLLINSTLLETFYVNNKQHASMEVYGKINALDMLDSSEKELPEETEIELMNLCGKYNISLLVLDGESQTVLATMHDSEMLKQQLLDNIFFTDQHRKRIKVLSVIRSRVPLIPDCIRDLSKCGDSWITETCSFLEPGARESGTV